MKALFLLAAIVAGSLYYTLDPSSIAENLAFYKLYPHTSDGKKALERAWKLLAPGEHAQEITLPSIDIQGIISLVTKQPFQETTPLKEEELALIEKISAKLANRKLQGHAIWTLEEAIALPPEEIDMARALLIGQLPDKNAIRNYEASLDLMALQIAARLPKNATDAQKIKEITRYIFQEMGFRFPPHAIHAQEIDLYTFLPSVLDGRQGVCLGVSILYLSLAQRLDLPLEIITPPGHIYVRYDENCNIETTSRGVHIPSEMYLGVNTRKLQQRNLKEVVGLAFVNEASVFWGKENYTACVALYEKALPFLEGDPLLNLFLGLNYLFIGEYDKGKALLTQVQGITMDYAVSPETLPDDYLAGRVDVEGLQAIFSPVDETRDSILKKQEKLQNILKRCPQFRAGLLQLAVTYLQLGRASEAQKILEQYHYIDPQDATVAYYLAVLNVERHDYNKAWGHLKEAQNLTAARSHHPKALKAVHNFLKRTCPE